MSDNSSIQWTEATWNPIRGCSIVSEGCQQCYAMKQAYRFNGKGQPYEGLTRIGAKGTPIWTGKIRLVPELLTQPLRWKKPRMIFVNSMSDLFHENVPDEFIDRVFAVMRLTPWHTYQILTKRPERMRQWATETWQPVPAHTLTICGDQYEVPAETEWSNRDDRVNLAIDWVTTSNPLFDRKSFWTDEGSLKNRFGPWPLPNVWLGVSVEDQATADKRTPLLRQTPAAVRWLSVEPLLGPVQLDLRDIGWVVVGGESGRDARPCDLAWIRSVVTQCKTSGVPCFVKQLGTWPYDGGASSPSHRGRKNVPREVIGTPYESFVAGYVDLHDIKGGDPSEWPADLRVREFPTLETEAAR